MARETRRPWSSRPRQRPERVRRVLFVHWYGPPRPTSNRTQFIPDAIELAKSGVVSLLIDTPWSVPEFFKLRKREDDYARSVQQPKDLRRALDVLLSLPQHRSPRGSPTSVTISARCTGRSRRPRIGGFARSSSWRARRRSPTGSCYGPPMPPDARQAFIDQMAPLDPTRHLAKLDVPVLLQFANTDEHVARAARGSGHRRRSRAEDGRFYDAGHELNEAATSDRTRVAAKSSTK